VLLIENLAIIKLAGQNDATIDVGWKTIATK
jgi:hypothetical protein